MESFLKMALSSFCCVKSAFHMQVSLWAQGRECPSSTKRGMDASLHATWADGRANLDIMISLRELAGSRPASLSSSTRLCLVKPCPVWKLLLS